MRRPEQVGVRVVPRGLMMPLLRPPPGQDAEFNDWYDTEHAPARNEIPGFLTARRWRAVPGWDGGDSTDPAAAAAEEAEPLHYAATFDLDDLAVLDSPAYLRLRARASDRERELAKGFLQNERRVYRPVLPAAVNRQDRSNLDELDICGRYLLASWWEADDDPIPEAERPDLAEHLRRATVVPGMCRVRVFERVDAEAPGRYLALYDLKSMAVFADSGWPTDMGARRRSGSRRLFKLWRRFDPPLS